MDMLKEELPEIILMLTCFGVVMGGFGYLYWKMGPKKTGKQ